MILRMFLLLYALAWGALLPLVLVYLRHRAKKDPIYLAHLGERFGFYNRPLPQNAIWLHGVSLGETRSAIGLIRLILARGDKVLITNFTPAGRREAERQFASEIASGQLAVIWVPFDMRWCYRRFFRATQPRIGLPLEVEVWPAMIFGARAAGVPLYMCNAQYGNKPLARDSKGLRLRQRIIRGFAGAFVKSGLQADRFSSIGLENIHVTGELRFDQPIPPALIEAADLIRPALQGREVITIASGVEGEEALYLEMIKALKASNRPPLIVYVPRAPERFGQVYTDLTAAGLRVIRRSESFGSGTEGLAKPPQTLAHDLAQADVLLGDSLGEMYFYLGLSDRVIVGGGFTPRGAHNIIEPLALMKPVMTGPWTWTIEFPFAEAEAAGIAKSLPDLAALLAHLQRPATNELTQIQDFMAQHRGASARTLAAIDRAARARAD